MTAVVLRFYAELNELLSIEHRGGEFEQHFIGRRSAKDLIESLGVPHTEVGLILCNGEPCGLDEIVGDGDRLAVYPVFRSLDVVVGGPGDAAALPGSAAGGGGPGDRRTRTGPDASPGQGGGDEGLRFVADVHLGRLAACLRLAGFDTAYRNDWDDAMLAGIAAREKRVLLTRDRGLLMRSAVTRGYLVRENAPRAQLREVVARFGLGSRLRLHARCSVCNGAVEPVPKQEVEADLQPLTRVHYQEFWRCTRCGKVYWKGSHWRSLQKLFDELTLSP
jgi:uncharacterized protein